MNAPKDDGFAIWMTGLPGAGKSTLSQLVRARLEADYGRRVEILDGDEVRKGLSRDLGMTRADREEHARRVSYVAKLLARNRVIPIVALISPYETSRVNAREVIGADRFVEVFVKAPLELCKKRDPKGLYAKALRGEIKDMTGIQDPYEEPPTPDLIVDTSGSEPQESAMELVDGLRRLGRL